MTTPCELVTQQLGLLFTCSPINEYIRIQTPFLYPDGDIIDIFYKDEGETATLTDLGETLRWLKMQTATLRRTPKQRQLIADICLNHNIELYRGMLVARMRQAEDLASVLMRLSQGILRVSDLWFTFRNRAGESIVDEVEDFLQEHHLAAERSPRISGRSSTIWRPEFQIRGPDHSSLVRVLSTGSSAATHDLIARTVTMWHDLSHLAVGSEAFSFISLFDDSFDVWKTEDFRLVEDLSEIAYWSRPDEFFEKIA
jgi:hypothetical protein